jgi:hypothetical protein
MDPCLFDARYNLLQLGVLPEASDCRYTPEQERLLKGAR